ncbi:MAG TPA: ABC transporter permease [Vicinamibacterales bacterium]|nr:ABC transporter permease [Vicinamibacterales bacterium]
MIERLLRRVRYWLRSRREDAALREELEFHHAMKQQELEREGMDARNARLAARRDLGNATLARETARAVWIWPWLDSVKQDVSYAVRSLRRQPGFTFVSLIVLGIAIGLNTSFFTVFAGLAIRPMPGVADAGRVVTVSGFNPLVRAVNGFSFPEYEFLASQSRAIAGLVAHRPMSIRLQTESVGKSTGAYLVTANYFDVLGVRMEHGRRFQPGEDRRGSQAVAILSHELWQTRFGGDAAIVGRQVRVNGLPVTVVGILSRDFGGPEGSASRIWLPFSMQPLLRPNDPFETQMLESAQHCCVNVAGRLATGATRAAAQTEMQLLSGRFRASAGIPERAIAVEGTQFLRGGRAASGAVAILGVLFVAMTLVLLIACANVGNLLLARATARVREIGVRLSLGAGRGRIVRQLLTEGFVLALIGSALGVLLAALPPIVLRLLSGDSAPFDLKPDGWVLGYGLLLAVVSCVAFALAPALHATSGNVANALKDDSKVLAARFPLRTTLLAVQVAVSVVMLTSAGLLQRGVARASVLDPGFVVDDVSVATIDLPDAYDPARVVSLVSDVTSGLRAAKVERFAFVTNEPLGDNSFMMGMRLQGESEDRMRTIEVVNMSPGYFDTLGIRLVAGRGFDDADAGRDVVIVNESMARLWPDSSALGRSVIIARGGQPIEIVGIVRDSHVASMEAIEPVLFLPIGGSVNVFGDRPPKLLFGTSDPSAAATVAGIVERVDKDARVEITPMKERLDDWLGGLAMAPLAASALGAFALGVATVGMLGVFSYVVRQRTREIGIRMALGARAADVIRVVLASSSKAVAAGLAVGFLGAVAASQVLRGSLYGVSPMDPIAYGAVVLVMAVAALAASYVPVRRAVQVDPVRALRYD